VIFFLEKNQTRGNRHRCSSRRPDQSGARNMKKAPGRGGVISVPLELLHLLQDQRSRLLRRGSLHRLSASWECLLVRVKLRATRSKGTAASDPERAMRPTRGVPRLTTSAVASVDSIGPRADAHCQAGSSNKRS
jgi:hypothetical protein